MHYNRNVYFFSHISHNIKIQLRLGDIHSMCRSERTCKRIDSCCFYKFLCQIRIGIYLVRICSGSGASRPCFPFSHTADFRFHGCAGLLRKGYDHLRIRCIFFKRKYRTVIHHGCKSDIQCFAYIIQRLTMIKMYTYRYFCFFCQFQHDRSDNLDRHDFFMDLCMLDDHRYVQLFRCSDHRHNGFQIWCVKGSHRTLSRFTQIQNLL